MIPSPVSLLVVLIHKALTGYMYIVPTWSLAQDQGVLFCTDIKQMPDTMKDNVHEKIMPKY